MGVVSYTVIIFLGALHIFLVLQVAEPNIMSDDPCSLSNPLQVIVKHWNLSVTPNFTNKILSGLLTVHATVLVDGANNLVSY